MRRFDENKNAIDIAFPVLAVECEASEISDKDLDSYERVVMKLISLGLSKKGIARTLNATESFIQNVFEVLKARNLVIDAYAKPWKLTEEGKNFLIDSNKEIIITNEKQYGYLFINSLKKELLPYFFKGNIEKVSLYKGEHLPLKLNINKDEKNTFEITDIKISKLKQAYTAYFRLKKQNQKHENIEDTQETIESNDLFADSDSFDEEIIDHNYETDVLHDFKDNLSSDKYVTNTPNDVFVRKLNKPALKLYLRMRIIIDPNSPGGYKAESPFNDFNGADNEFFRRQIQWCELSQKVFVYENHNNTNIKDFLENEIWKISRNFKPEAKVLDVYLLENLPLIKTHPSEFTSVYNDMKSIYPLIQHADSLFNKANCISSISSLIVEVLFNRFFKKIAPKNLRNIKKQAFEDLDIYGADRYLNILCKRTKINYLSFNEFSFKRIQAILSRLTYSHGNSIEEKFINLLVINFYYDDEIIQNFLSQEKIDLIYENIKKLNHIRIKVSHAVEEKLTDDDYTFYIENIFKLVNTLMQAFVKD